jgi:predicted exporter
MQCYPAGGDGHVDAVEYRQSTRLPGAKAGLQPLVLGGTVDEGGWRAAAGVLLPVLLQMVCCFAGALARAENWTSIM